MKRHASEALPPLLLSELAQIKRWRKTAIKGKDPEGVHQLRVSLRRMRSALDVFEPVLQPDYRRHWRKVLKFLARSVDEARDLDVFLMTHFSEGGNASELEKHLRRQHKRSYKSLSRLLQSKQFNKPRRQLKKQLKNKHWRAKYGHHSGMLTTTLAARQLQQCYDRVLAQQSAISLDDEAALHALRISIKKLRYGCELLAPVLDNKNNTVFISAMKTLQDDLGLIHDASVQQSMLSALPAGAQDEFSRITFASEASSAQLKTTLAEKLQYFSTLPLPWNTLS